MPAMGTMPIYRQGRTYQVPARRPGVSTGGDKLVGFIVMFLFLLSVPFVLVSCEKKHYNEVEAFHEVEDNVVELAYAARGKVVHLQAKSLQSVSEDAAFGIWIEGALSLHRFTEYCQWEESSTRYCKQCFDHASNSTVECDCTVTYHYVKDWRPYLISSLLFDEKAVHWNPQRNPYPSHHFYPTQVSATDVSGIEATVGGALLNSESIRAPSRRVVWTRGAVPEPSFLNQLFGLTDTARYEEVRSLRSVLQSRAYDTDKFVYVGQGGYFFSRYEGTIMGQLFNWFGQYLEGSLTDVQAGDALSFLGFGCQAGDIRASFRVQDPAEISVLAGLAPNGGRKLRRIDRDGRAYTFEEVRAYYKDTYTPRQLQSYWENMKQPSAVELEPFFTQKRHRIGYVHAGIKTWQMMFADVLSDSWWKCLFARLSLAPWAWVVGSYVMLPPWIGGMTLPLSQGDWRAAAGVYLFALAMIWGLIWGIELDTDWHDACTPVFLAMGLGLVSWPLLGSSAEKGSEHAKTEMDSEHSKSE